MKKLYGIMGSSLLGLSVVLGAFGAHWLEANYPARSVELFNTAAHYQSIHGLAILILWVASQCLPSKSFSGPVWCFFTGIIIFSGSLYLLALLPDYSWLGMITPIGGLLFIVAWTWMIIGICKLKNEN